MKILYVHQYFTTPKGSGGIRSYAFARRWVEQGHTVHVICSISFDSSLSEAPTRSIDGISYEILGGSYKPQMGFYRRLYSYILFAIGSCWRTFQLRRDYDILLATSTPLTVALPALIWAWFSSKPYVFEVRDVWPDAAIDAGLLRNSLLIKLARRLERAAYEKAGCIVALSDGMKDRIRSRVPASTAIEVIPNSCDLEIFLPPKDKAQLRESLGLPPRKFVIVYSGAINIANDIDFISDVIIAAKEFTDLLFMFIGEGNRFPLLKETVDRHGISNVWLLGKQNKLSAATYVAAADLGLVTFIRKPVYYDNSPNKFFDYIAAGVPAVFNRSTWLAPYLQQYNAGFIFSEDTPNEFAQKLYAISQSRGILNEMSKNARTLASEIFSREVLSSRYADILKKTTRI